MKKYLAPRENRNKVNRAKKIQKRKGKKTDKVRKNAGVRYLTRAGGFWKRTAKEEPKKYITRAGSAEGGKTRGKRNVKPGSRNGATRGK